jgi:Holliday junction DNA helicase RuvA
MIRHIRGTVSIVEPTYAVVDVHGIGYLVYITGRTHLMQNEEAHLYTYLAVRENALDLYGFTTLEELHFFELLLQLPKIGPKSALQILSQADTSLLQSAILSQDPAHLSKMSGITKKTAEKIVLGLKDIFETHAYAYGNKSGTDAVSQANALFTSDTIDALVTLGYPQADARKAVQQLLNEKPHITNVNDAIKEVLRILG